MQIVKYVVCATLIGCSGAVFAQQPSRTHKLLEFMEFFKNNDASASLLNNINVMTMLTMMQAQLTAFSKMSPEEYDNFKQKAIAYAMQHQSDDIWDNVRTQSEFMQKTLFPEYSLDEVIVSGILSALFWQHTAAIKDLEREKVQQLKK
jgi:hypothetical protein